MCGQAAGRPLSVHRARLPDNTRGDSYARVRRRCAATLRRRFGFPHGLWRTQHFVNQKQRHDGLTRVHQAASPTAAAAPLSPLQAVPVGRPRQQPRHPLQRPARRAPRHRLQRVHPRPCRRRAPPALPLVLRALRGQPQVLRLRGVDRGATGRKTRRGGIRDPSSRKEFQQQWRLNDHTTSDKRREAMAEKARLVRPPEQLRDVRAGHLGAVARPQPRR